MLTASDVLQVGRFTLKPHLHDFTHCAVHALVSLRYEPLLSQVIQMVPTLKRTVAYEEVLFDIADCPLVFAYGAGTTRPAYPWFETISCRQIDKARLKLGRAWLRMDQYGGRPVVDQHFLQYATKVLNTADESFEGVLGDHTLCTPETETLRVGRLIDDEVDLCFSAASVGVDLAPVALQLLSGRLLRMPPPNSDGKCRLRQW